MENIPLKYAIILWNPGINGNEPEFAVRYHDHDDYSKYRFKVGACFVNWRSMSDEERQLQLMIDIWHIAAFYEVPMSLMTEQLLQIPEYRSMLADDCLPKQYQHERDYG